jgi:hypothetical protein
MSNMRKYMRKNMRKNMTLPHSDVMFVNMFNPGCPTPSVSVLF